MAPWVARRWSSKARGEVPKDGSQWTWRRSDEINSVGAKEVTSPGIAEGY